MLEIKGYVHVVVILFNGEVESVCVHQSGEKAMEGYYEELGFDEQDIAAFQRGTLQVREAMLGDYAGSEVCQAGLEQ